jgi:hypothetical protein
MVPATGLEPVRCYSLEPERRAPSANRPRLGFHPRRALRLGPFGPCQSRLGNTGSLCHPRRVKLHLFWAGLMVGVVLWATWFFRYDISPDSLGRAVWRLDRVQGKVTKTRIADSQWYPVTEPTPDEFGGVPVMSSKPD